MSNINNSEGNGASKPLPMCFLFNAGRKTHNTLIIQAGAIARMLFLGNQETWTVRMRALISVVNGFASCYLEI